MTEQEQISVFDMFKIGVGPSSSHTLGPWRSALSFLESIQKNNILDKLAHVKVDLFGSLAKTGKGHGTDIAMILGLSGYDPVTFDVDSLTKTVNGIVESKKINLGGAREIGFAAMAATIAIIAIFLPVAFIITSIFFCLNLRMIPKSTLSSATIFMVKMPLRTQLHFL